LLRGTGGRGAVNIGEERTGTIPGEIENFEGGRIHEGGGRGDLIWEGREGNPLTKPG